MNKVNNALKREAGLIADQMCVAATLVSKANYARQGRYLQLFFLLSIAFERASKLIIVIDYMIEWPQKPPTEGLYRKYDHNLIKLFKEVERISNKLNIWDYGKMPNTQIHNDIIDILTEFACNVTRYYNFNVIAQKENNNSNEPIFQWYQKVMLPLFEKHVSKQKKEQILTDALSVSRMMEERAVVAHIDEAGVAMNTMLESSFQTGLLEAVAPYTRLYILQICRFLGEVLSEQGRIAMSSETKDIPYMADFFRVFCNEDSYLRRRKTWEYI